MAHRIPGQYKTDSLLEITAAEEGLASSSESLATNLTITIPTPFAEAPPVTNGSEPQQRASRRSRANATKPAMHHYLEEGVDTTIPAETRVKWIDIHHVKGEITRVWVSEEDEEEEESGEATWENFLNGIEPPSWGAMGVLQGLGGLVFLLFILLVFLALGRMVVIATIGMLLFIGIPMPETVLRWVER